MAVEEQSGRGAEGQEPTYEELKQRVKALELAKKHSRAWLEHSPVCTKIVDLNYNLQYMSRAGVEGLGIDDIRDFYGAPYPLNFYPDAFKEQMTASMDRVIASGEIATQEAPILDTQGQELWFHSTIVPVKNDKGDIAYLIIVSVDTTERNQLEKSLKDKQVALEEQQSLLTQASEIAGLGFAIWDEIKQEYISVSDGYAAIHGYSREEYLKHFNSLEAGEALIHPEDRQRYNEYAVGDDEDGQDTFIEYRLLMPDGSFKYIVECIHYCYDDEGRKTQSIVTLQDISERKRREVELKEALDKADAANRAKSTFLSTMSHEIRTPLNGVLGMAQILRDTELDETQREHVDVIIDSGEILLELLNGILDISKIEENQLQLETTVFDLDSILEKCDQLWRPRIEEKGVGFAIANNAPALTGLVGDPTRFYQVLQNLLSNALKFTNEGVISLTMDLSEESSEQVLLKGTVQDTGIGIASEDKDLLFDRFSQVDASISRMYGGSGLGLAICSELTSLMGGSISVKSTPGTGSTFTFTARLKKQARQSPAASSSPASSQHDEAPQFDPATRILIAEDNPFNQKVVVALLKSVGLHADVAENGMQAIAMAQKTAYDLILMDIQMPELDGLAATAKIQILSDHYCSIPIIAISANVSEADKAHYLSSGMTDFLPKPIIPDTLYGVLSKYVPPADTLSEAELAG